jgi:predicted MFS family arabinose efflux permease
MKKNNHLKFIFLLNFVNILVIISAGFMIPLWGDFVKKIGGDVQTAGTAVAVFSIIIGFFTFIAGKIVSKFDNDSWFMVVTQLIRMFAYLGYFFVTKPMDLYMVQVALGISGAFQAPALYSLYHKCMPKENTPFYWGLWTGFYNISIGIGAFISAYIVSHLGFNAMFAGLFGVAAFGLCVAIYTKYQIARIA